MSDMDILNGVASPEPEDILEGIVEEEGSFDPSTAVQVVSSGGGSAYVPVSEPTAFSTILSQSGLFVNGAVEYWMNGARITPETIVPAGARVTIVGAVKGG